jgi:hypothetical protein
VDLEGSTMSQTTELSAEKARGNNTQSILN